MTYKAIFILAVSFAIILLSSKAVLTEEATPFVYDSKGKRDPFTPPITRDEARSYSSLDNIETLDDLVLEGIIWDARGDSVVMLNGVLLREGDIVSNIEVTKITPDRVFLKINEQRFELRLQKEEGWR